MSHYFDRLTIQNPAEILYGLAPHPLKLPNGLVIGGGVVYPEINFSLPPMEINETTMPEVIGQYREMIAGVLARARELAVPGLIVEVELLPPTTVRPAWGIEITRVVLEAMREHEARYGLKSALRITPNDIREMVRPPLMRRGEMLRAMLETFRGCAELGAEMLAIESTGGKEIHDDALLQCDLQTSVFALGVLGARDMDLLWREIVAIARETGSVAAGDSACGFGNTAMILAEKGYIPRVFAAVVRVVSVARSLVAYEAGAVGPSKDCAYEGPYIKAITGYPISMEGKSASCAHLSPLGNIPAAVTDLWSNESVQNVKLLGGMAPVVSMEQLAYDCRLLNTAAAEGREAARKLRDWLADSDGRLDPQAYVLRPEVILRLGAEILKHKTPYLRAKAAAQAAVAALKEARASGAVKMAERELPWLDRMEREVEAMPANEDAAWRLIKDRLDTRKFIPEEYGVA